MISHKRLEEQMKRINFHYKGWGRSEVDELCNIIMPDEEIEECVNGYYEAGFALLVATKDRLLLVDKKPMGYLTVEDMRFDMINEFDLHHRLMGAQIKVSAGSKTLHFTSLNQVRLRRLLNFVQARMTQIKKDKTDQQDAQKQHLEEMNEQLRLYLMAAHKQQFVDQAQAIQQPPSQGYMLPPVQAPAAAYFTQQPQPQAMQWSPVPSGLGPQPASPFEEVAAAAFDAQQTIMPTPSSSPTPTARALPKVDRFDPIGAVVRGAGHALQGAEQVFVTPQQIGLAAVRRVVPIVTSYARLPLINRREQAQQGSVTPEAA